MSLTEPEPCNSFPLGKINKTITETINEVTLTTTKLRQDNLLNLNSINKPVYYLISQDLNGSELYDVLNKNDCLSGIHKKTEIIKIDTEDIDNLFEIIKEEEKYLYKIIHIHKQHKNVFKVDDLIYLDFGIISFYTKTINGKIDKTEVLQTEIIEKVKILLYNSIIDIKMRALLDLMNDDYTENEDYKKVKNCINSIL